MKISQYEWNANSVGPGWKSIVEPLIALCKETGTEIHQIKEKFGGLRFYVGPALDHVHAAIDAAMEQAEKTCEICGDPGVARAGGWVKTLCDTHAKQ